MAVQADAIKDVIAGIDLPSNGSLLDPFTKDDRIPLAA